MHVMSTADCEMAGLTPLAAVRSPASESSVYYVQSPSRDSNDDGEKTVTSANSTTELMSPTASSSHSTPALMSPMASPSHSQSSVERQSLQGSSFTGFSVSMKPRGPCRKSGMAFDGTGRKRGAAAAAAMMRRMRKGEDRFGAIEEKGLLEGEEEDDGLHRRCSGLAFLVGFAALFSVFLLVLLGVSRSQKPDIAMKSIKFENFFVQAGIDASMVPTSMVTLNSTVRLTFRNTGTFFGIHVCSAHLDLAYDKLVLATGSMNTFYQSRQSKRSVEVAVVGRQVPLYGGGESMAMAMAMVPLSGRRRTYPPIPLRLSFVVKARAYVLGRLVIPKFHIHVQCSVTMDHAKFSSSVSLHNSCRYY